ncbi:galectin-1 [Anolis carolinensis]|uniref:galectin-1 n=1 Tax=Anolis carolinensis TaxID=28377 RepID=UPI000203968B|nr:PREDICTED: galectin-1 [Anolis carolinensis]|eukprot:XP_003220996.1 PREDICTED: galectin-1 [Anolis carolinensis]
MPGFLCTNLNIPPGRRIAMKGNLSAGAKSFVVNLGKNKDDFILHFNGRFDAHGDTRTIVCNSKSKGQWGTELRESHFPFQEGSPAELFFTHDKKEVTITLPGNHQFKFPNALAAEGIEFICVEGDIDVTGISFA